jgi:hypothetical protein
MIALRSRNKNCVVLVPTLDFICVGFNSILNALDYRLLRVCVPFKKVPRNLGLRLCKVGPLQAVTGENGNNGFNYESLH